MFFDKVNSSLRDHRSFEDALKRRLSLAAEPRNGAITWSAVSSDDTKKDRAVSQVDEE